MPVINVNVAKGGRGTRRPLSAGEWDAKLIEVNAKESSQKKTPFVELVWQVADPDAVDTTGSVFKGKVWDQLYVTEKSFFRVLKAASELGVTINLDEDDNGNAEVETEDLVEAFRDAVGDEATVVTSLEDDPQGREYDDNSGDVKQYVRVQGYKS
jgi:hypothetical protein